jgi:tryptophan 2,3-dioxygenase
MSGGAPPAAAFNSASKRPAQPLYYGDYLQVDKILSAQAPRSREAGCEAHEEMLFITTHQVCAQAGKAGMQWVALAH